MIEMFFFFFKEKSFPFSMANISELSHHNSGEKGNRLALLGRGNNNSNPSRFEFEQ